MNAYFATSQYVFLEAQSEQKLPSFFLLANISRCGPIYLCPSTSSIKLVLCAICVNVIRLRIYSSLFLSLVVNLSSLGGKE